MLPIFNNSNGRDVIGHAKTIKQADLTLRKKFNVSQQMKLEVWRRSPFMQDLLELPDGFCYSISYSY